MEKDMIAKKKNTEIDRIDSNENRTEFFGKRIQE